MMRPSEQYELINQYRKTAPVDVEGLARALGISVRRAYLGSDLSGMIERHDEDKYLITVNAAHVLTRQRFTVAHELGHYMLHRQEIGDGMEDDAAYRSSSTGRYKNSCIGPREETQANQFAANLLMPWELLEKLREEGFSLPEQAARLASRLEVSLRAMRIRLGLPAES